MQQISFFDQSLAERGLSDEHARVVALEAGMRVQMSDGHYLRIDERGIAERVIKTTPNGISKRTKSLIKLPLMPLMAYAYEQAIYVKLAYMNTSGQTLEGIFSVLGLIDPLAEPGVTHALKAAGYDLTPLQWIALPGIMRSMLTALHDRKLLKIEDVGPRDFVKQDGVLTARIRPVLSIVK